MHSTSISLLERLRRPGEQDAWVRFVHLYTPLLYHWGRQLGLAPEDAADLVQDVFTTLVQKLPEFTYQPHKSFRGWLHTIVRNRWRDRCRRLAAAPVVTGGALPDIEAADPTTAFAEVEYRQHLVQQALRLIEAEFEPITWQACREYLVHGRPAAEVARELGITTNAVYLAKVRVLACLRQHLDGLLD
jgi:RNA polymerase sigma-70 factor (ECF subfamily)